MNDPTTAGMIARQQRGQVAALKVPVEPASTAASGVTGVVQLGSSSVVNAPISWSQFLGGLLSDYLSPDVVLAFLGSISLWLSGAGTITERGIIQAIVIALIAAAQAARAVSGNDGLARRLRATGQLHSGT